MSKKKKKSKVHEDLEGLEITINEFGQVVINKPIDELNEFLDENVDDKKLENHPTQNKQEQE